MTRWLALGMVVSLSGCVFTVNGKRVDPFAPSKPEPAPAARSQPAAPAAAPSPATAAAPKPAEPVAAAVTVELDPNAEANPLVIDVAPLPTTKSSTNAGYAQCDNSDSYMTEGPAVRLVIKEKTKLLMVSSHAGMLVSPERRFWCYEHKSIGSNPPLQVMVKDFEPGTWELYAMGRNGQNVATHLEFTMLERLPRDLAKVFDAAPPLTAKLQGTLNPVWAQYEPKTPAYDARYLKLECAQGRDVYPLTRLVVEDASTWKLSGAGNRNIYLKGEDGSCLSFGGDLKKGRYEVYVGDWPKTTEPIELALVDEERAMQLGEAPVVNAGDLKKPLPVKVTVGGDSFRPRPLCGAGEHVPTFYVDVKKPLDTLSVQNLVSNGKLTITVAGPLEVAKRPYEWCKTGGSAYLEKAKGRYAVWVSAPAGEGGTSRRDARNRRDLRAAKGGDAEPDLVGDTAWAVLKTRFSDHVADLKAKGEPMEKLAPVPAELDLKARQVWWHYPYYPRDTKAVEPLFLDAPKQLFVFLGADADEVKAGEPLLLERWGDEKSTVLRATGEKREVRTERLTLQQPAKVVMPSTWPEIERPGGVKDAYKIVSPVDRPKFAKWENEDAKVYGCVGKWMEKNDPTWGKKYDLVNLRTGETLSDRKFRQADKVCGSAKVEAAGKALAKSAYSSRVGMREKLKKTLPSKLK